MKINNVVNIIGNIDDPRITKLSNMLKEGLRDILEGGWLRDVAVQKEIYLLMQK
jgi:hypothetical protein